jgi:hypothetical protein
VTGNGLRDNPPGDSLATVIAPIAIEPGDDSEHQRLAVGLLRPSDLS